ncbi:uncharacterized protein LOC118448616 isoform X1 [Vespa mandarinia]|uniref:uncharacterized protein LOC118448616 isoform X1 n=1 Tax=Vespa mandarinia TaxID=7446 RepID=UPI00161D8AB8|nr:uncharacterized protein LOC118448616 isoform X1 [Vespa mandarinia]XP_035737996.1 uncharacterized protein LOC118448616 isoform X1 [Vespa mandarinia]
MATLKGVFPNLTTTRKKNFIQENVKNLRRMEQCFHSNKESDELEKFQINRHRKKVNKYSNITAKVNTSFHGNLQNNHMENMSNKQIEIIEKEPLRKISTPILNKKNSVPIKKPLNSLTNKLINKQTRKENIDNKNVQPGSKIKVTSDPNFIEKSREDVNSSPLSLNTKYKHKGIQTIEEKHIDQLYMEGIIRYPTKKNLKNNEEKNKSESYKLLNSPSELESAQFASIELHDSPKISELPIINEKTDIVKPSKDRNSVATKIAAQLNNGVVPTNYRKGVVPKYIKDRKEAQQKAEEAKTAAFCPECPEGHVPLPDHERQETLRMLKKNYQDYVNELNMMPIKTDTLRAQKRKMEIEKQLNKLEEAIKVFSRPKVYVKINA